MSLIKRFLVNLLLIAISTSGFAQLDAGEDQIICVGEIAELNASGASNYEWTSIPNDPTLSDPNISNPTVQPTTTTTYIVTSREVGNNIINNGNFEQGNVGFTSEYTYNPVSIWDEGTYAVVSDANSVHANFFCDEDHTTGSGNMMCVNGAGTTNVEVWSATIPFLTQHTEFEFATWITSLVASSPAILQFSINGELLGQPFQAAPTTCIWNQFFEEWNSGTSSSATISIVNQNTATSGNDFALDDISFSVVYYYTDTVVVEVVDLPTSNFSLQENLCSIDTATILYSGNAPDTATFHWEFDGGTILTGSNAGPFQLTWNTPGEKTVSLWVEHACTSDTTYQTIMVHQNPEALITADLTSIPYGTNTTLHGNISGNPGPFDFNWKPASELVDPSLLDPVTQLLYTGTAFIFEVTDESSLCFDDDTLFIEVTGGPLLLTTLMALPDTVCPGESTDLTFNIEGGSGNYIATWYSDPTGFSHVGPELSITVTPSASTTYYMSVNDGFATTPVDSVVVTILPLTSISSQPIDVSTAPNQLVTFSATGSNAEQYQWQLSTNGGLSWTDMTDDSSVSGSQTSTVIINPTTLDMNGWFFRCTIQGRCNAETSSQAELSILEAPTMVNSLQDAEGCQQDTIQVAYQVSNFIDIVDFQVVLEFDPAHLSFLDLKNIAPELEQDIVVTNQGDGVTVSWSSNPMSLVSENAFSFRFIIKTGANSNLNWDTGLCYAINSLNYNTPMNFSNAEISSMALPLAPNYIYCDRDTINISEEIDIQLTAEGGSGDQLIWTFNGCDGAYIGEGNPLSIFRPDSTSTYFAYWENACGTSECQQVEVVITETIIYGVYAPTAFTPNNDGINDNFSLICPSDLYTFRLMIFNRWGEQIFETTDLYQGWDGTFNGTKLESGVFVWKAIIQYRREGPDSEQFVETGNITLVR